MDNTAAIIAAMASVPDVRINKDGSSVKISDKSILHKSKPELAPDERLKTALSQNALVSDDATLNNVNAEYRKMLGLAPTEEKKPTPTKLMEVGHTRNEEAYFELLVKKMKKN